MCVDQQCVLHARPKLPKDHDELGFSARDRGKVQPLRRPDAVEKVLGLKAQEVTHLQKDGRAGRPRLARLQLRIGALLDTRQGGELSLMEEAATQPPKLEPLAKRRQCFQVLVSRLCIHAEMVR